MTRAKAFLRWAVETFGIVATHPDERLARFVEEAIELADAGGMSRETLARIIERVLSRPKGDISQEIGQAMCTLTMLAENLGLSADAEADREFARVQTIPKEEWTRRHTAKVALKIANLSPIDG